MKIDLLQSEIISSQSGIIDLQNDSGIVDSGINDLEYEQCSENDFVAPWLCSSYL